MRHVGRSLAGKASRTRVAGAAWLVAVACIAGFTVVDALSPFTMTYPLEAWLIEEANQRIFTIRRGTITLDFGPGNASKPVFVHQLSHAFKFGCNAYFLNQITDPDLLAFAKEKFSALFNFATLPFYMKAYNEFNPGLAAWQDRLREMTAWVDGTGAVPKGHPLIWQIPGQVPDEMEFNPDPSEREAFALRHIETILGNHTDIEWWDLVNEMTHVQNILLGDTAVQTWNKASTAARAARPDAKFIVNEYETIQPGHPATARHDGGRFYDFLQQIIAAGNPPDAIGFQGHEFINAWVPARDIIDTFDGFGTFRIPCHVTEFDTAAAGYFSRSRTIRRGVMTPETQAALAARAYTMFFSHPAIDAITWWAFYKDLYWQPEKKVFMLDDDGTLHPVYDALHDLICKQWNSTSTHVLDAQGRLDLVGFYGTYSVTVQGCSPVPFSIVDTRSPGERPWRVADV